MVIYVSSPYKAVLNAVNDSAEAKSLIIGYAIKGAQIIKEMGYTPLSPVLNFEGVYEEESEREVILKAGLELLKVCDGILIVNTPYSDTSAGMVLELESAKRLNLALYETLLDEKGGINGIKKL
ncbi:hypothetical protein [Helicobacter typhlonius]|uniref:DUF7768 domain-containing protein n=1 Tax=Helicobacter typhlonius TaxID=76936 RepID=UPI002FDF7394